MIDDDVLSLAQALGDQLSRAGLVLSCAESCTGGLVASAITAIAGSSRWFDRGFVTYSNQAKMDHLGVPAETLQSHGAVSRETAEAMARGVLLASPVSQLAVSTTGIAGPGGATPGKPVGTVCFGLAWRQAGRVHTRSVTQLFGGDRGQVRKDSVKFALAAVTQQLASLD
jgi:nicotinamide-nucleotide amidase